MSNKTVTPVARELMKARAAITPKEKWCQGTSRVGGAFCAIATIVWNVRYSMHLECEAALMYELKRRGEVPEIYKFNDTHTHEEVLGLFDAAVEWELTHPQDREIKNVRDEAK